MMSTMFRPVIYGPCSGTGVVCVASDFYIQIVPPKSEATHMTPVREQGP